MVTFDGFPLGYEVFPGNTHDATTAQSIVGDIVAHQPRRKEIHVICDNLSAHKTKGVDDFLAEHPNVHLHYTPTYLSWLNQVELWFSKIERDVASSLRRAWATSSGNAAAPRSRS